MAITINSLLSAGEMPLSLAPQFKGALLELGHGRTQTAIHTNVPEPTLPNVDAQKHQTSLRQLSMLCDAYGDLTACDQLSPLNHEATAGRLQ